MSAFGYVEACEYKAIRRAIKRAKVTEAKTKSIAAKRLYEALRQVAKDLGMNPDLEVSIWKPGEHGHGDCWRVSFEAGPHQWAIGASSDYLHNDRWYTEPFYSFDVCFEDK